MAIFNPISAVRFFLQKELWNPQSAPGKIRQGLYGFVKVIYLSVHGFRADKCNLQAASLTYITLISLVPILAIMFSFSKGLGMHSRLMQAVGIHSVAIVGTSASGDAVSEVHYEVILDQEKTPESKKYWAATLPEPIQRIIINVFSYVEKTNFAALGIIGSLALIASVIFSLAKLETNLNVIWGVHAGRPFFRQLSEYLVILILLPLIFLAATSLNTLLSSPDLQVRLSAYVPSLGWVAGKACRLLATLFIVAGFTFFYAFMPNTRVSLPAALAAGTVTGCIWLVVQWLYISMQLGLTSYNAIYGTFAVFPFFLAWLYANWCLVLFGAELSFAIHNHQTLSGRKAGGTISQGGSIVLGTLALYHICANFKRGSAPWDPLVFARDNRLPVPVVLYALTVLAENHLISAVVQPDTGQTGYLPAQDTRALTLASVEEAFRKNTSGDAQMYMQLLPPHLAKMFIDLQTRFRQELGEVSYDRLVDSTGGK